MAISKLSHKCKKCPHVGDCNEKRMVACAYVEPSMASMIPSLTPNMTTRITRETIVINTGDNALGRAEFYRDEIEREITKRLYAGLNCTQFSCK